MGNRPSASTSQTLTGKNLDLWNACWDGNTHAAQMLIKDGAKIGSNDEYYGASCLMIACAFGHIETARMLIEHGAKVNGLSTDGQSVDSCAKQTPLHAVCTIPNKCSANMIDMLIDCGANPAMVDAKNRTPIDMARAHMPGLVAKLEESCAVVSQKMDYLDVTEETSRWSRRSSLVFNHSEVHVDIVPVMSEPGVNYGAYSHELVWYRGDDYLGMHPLKESTVHVEECAAEEKAPERFNIVLVNAADETAKPVTFSVESEKAAVDMSNTFRTLCGTFNSKPPLPPSRASRASATSRPSNVSAPRLSTSSVSTGRSSTGSRKSDVALKIEFLNRRGGPAPMPNVPAEHLAPAPGSAPSRPRLTRQLSADQFSKYASESNNDRAPVIRRQERTSKVVNYYYPEDKKWTIRPHR